MSRWGEAGALDGAEGLESLREHRLRSLRRVENHAPLELKAPIGRVDVLAKAGVTLDAPFPLADADTDATGARLDACLPHRGPRLEQQREVRLPQVSRPPPRRGREFVL